jgi:phage terminase large subunit GpA-like protein
MLPLARALFLPVNVRTTGFDRIRTMRRAKTSRSLSPYALRQAGFRLNALISLVANATWAQLAQEFLTAKGDPAEGQVLVNTILGQGWSTPAMINEDALAARAEPFDLNDTPKEVLILTAGGDVQDDRVEITICAGPTTMNAGSSARARFCSCRGAEPAPQSPSPASAAALACG